ncbi:MAG TPA: hypothetical protein DCO79_08150 [Spirochaeta sp.]|nr:hypothetical protein [Spirochaeta sp.]
MAEFFASFDLTLAQWFIMAGAAAIIGLNKAGVVGLSLLAIPFLAMIFGGKTSTGVILSLLVVADCIAVISYRKFVRFDKFLGLLPWTVAGMLIALVVGNMISDEIFKIFIAAAIIVVLVFMILNEIRGRDRVIESRWYLNAAVGLLGGFTSLIGNVAGPILAVYFLSLRLDKDEFVATRAWFFWIVNLLKLPMHIFVWKTVTPKILVLSLFALPIILLGALLGIYLVKKIPDKPYRVFIIIATFVSAVVLFF